MARFGILLPVILGLAACSFSTDDRPPVPPGSSAPIVPARKEDPAVEKWFREAAPASGMRLMSGDRISISVQGKPELGVIRDVPPNGELPLYRVDATINALGRTTQELESDIAKAYSALFEKPYVTVSLETAAARSIYLLGAVKTPGAYPVTGNERLNLAQALALAGGTAAQSDLRNVTIQRTYPPTGRTVASPSLDVQRVYEGDQSDNLLIEAGDTIMVPDLQESRVQVLGYVERPGSVVWTRGMTLSRALAEAGGFRKFAKKEKIKVVRHGRESIVVNYDDVLNGATPDLELEARDVIFVDERWL